MTATLAPAPTAPVLSPPPTPGRPLQALWLGVVLQAVGPVLVAGSSVSGPVFSFVRLWLGVPVIAGFTMLSGRRLWAATTWRGWRWGVGAGVLFGAHQLLWMSALKLSSVTDVTLTNTLAPLVVAAAAVKLFGERPTRAFLGWSVLAIVGAAIVVVGGVGGPSGNALGMALALANMVVFSGFFLVSKRSRGSIDVWPFLLLALLVAAVLVSAYVLVTLGRVPTVPATDAGLALAVAVLPGAVGHFLMTWPLQWVAANVPPVLRLLQPLVAGLLALVFLGQGVTVFHLVGGALTIVGVAAAIRARPPEVLVTTVDVDADAVLGAR